MFPDAMNYDAAESHVLEVARLGKNAYLRVKGRATFSLGPALKRFGLSAIEGGCSLMVLDALGCENMDSTFLGVLAGLATRLNKQKGGAMLMLNVSDGLFEVLRTLGLDQLMDCRKFHGTGQEIPAGLFCPLDGKSFDISTTQKVMLEAHKSLSEVSPENELRFKDVMAYLREASASSSRPGAEGGEGA